MTMDGFTPIHAASGGLMIGASAALLLLLNGRIAGISGILGGLLTRSSREIGWRLAFVAGLILAPLVHAGLRGSPVAVTIDALVPAAGARRSPRRLWREPRRRLHQRSRVSVASVAARPGPWLRPASS
jgi:uncharacterized membrane protein YedE/YeeE